MPPFSNPMATSVFEAVVITSIIYFVEVGRTSNANFLIAVIYHQSHAHKVNAALEGTVAATMSSLFFALCGC